MVAPWEKTSSQMVNILWQRVLTQAEEAGVEVPSSIDISKVPKELQKMAYFTDVLKVLIEDDPSKYMNKQKSTSEYFDKVLARKLGWKRTSDVSAEKQNQLLGLRSTLPFAKLANNYTIDALETEANAVRIKMLKSPEWGDSLLKDEFLSEEYKLSAHGFSNPLFLAGHANVVAGASVMPWTSMRDGKIEELPMPERYYVDGCRRTREQLGLGVGQYLNPAHLLVGSPSSGGRCIDGEGTVVISNSAGAPGMPYPTIPNARELTTDGNRATKANVAQIEMEVIVDWLEAGCPWTGPTYDRLAQPNTMWKRGDAKVRVDLLAFALALQRAGFPLCIMLLPGRGIVIVATCQTLLESTFFKPIQEHLTDGDVQTIDLRTRRFAKQVINGMLNAVASSDMARAVGADISRWDLNAYPGEHAAMAAFVMSLFPPGDRNILCGAASRPAIWGSQLVAELVQGMNPGDEMLVSVDVPNVNNEGTHIEQVPVKCIAVNFRKMIAQVYQMVHGSGVHMAGYDLSTKVSKVRVPAEIVNLDGYDHQSKDIMLFVHGAIRSGSGGTSINNSLLNSIVTEGAGTMLSESNVKGGLVSRRATWFGLPKVSKVLGYNERQLNRSIFRGDDSVRLIYQQLKDPQGKDLGAEFIPAFEYALVGRLANPDKQRTGDYRRPDIEYASEYYDMIFPSGITDFTRTLDRVLIPETETTPGDLKPRLGHEFDDEFDKALVLETMAVKSRLAPQRGATGIANPMGSPTPGNHHFIKFVASMDKFGLVYGMDDMNSGELQAYIESEALARALREVKKHNLDEEVIDEIVDEWREAELHSLLFDLWEQKRERMAGRRKDAGPGSFEEKVASLGRS